MQQDQQLNSRLRRMPGSMLRSPKFRPNSKNYIIKKNLSQKETQHHLQMRSSQEDQAIKILDLISIEDQMDVSSSKEKNREKVCSGRMRKYQIEDCFEMGGWAHSLPKEKTKSQFHCISQSPNCKINTFCKELTYLNEKNLLKLKERKNYEEINKVFEGYGSRRQGRKRIVSENKSINYSPSLPYTNGLSPERTGNRMKTIEKEGNYKNYLNKKQQIANLHERMLTINPEEVQKVGFNRVCIEKKDRKFLKNSNLFSSYVFKKNKFQNNLKIEGVIKNIDQSLGQFHALNKILKKQEKDFLKFDIEKYRHPTKNKIF